MTDNNFLSPKSDIIFKLLFGDEKSIEILTDFLKAVLDIPESDYEDVTIVDPHLLRQHEGDKLGILDVKVKTKSKKIIDIEIQVKPKPNLEKRVVLYLSKMVAEQVGAGIDYSKIQRAISIIITDYTLKSNNNKYHNRFSLADETGEQFTDILEVNTLELSKLPETEDGTLLWEWMKFLKSESKEEFDMIAERNPVINKAVVRLAELSQDERTRMLYESRQMLEWDIDIGKQAARQDERYTIARNAIRKNMSIVDVMDITGLTFEEVEALQNADF
ncbi:MAG: Rpn family recombination-promoting nuclease/putative transposase [Defluviitaleaceae bacterium]|nr:Rpn family recombination-promoting nuclease/putative transposase [Defluviitaleaceae bacterium]